MGLWEPDSPANSIFAFSAEILGYPAKKKDQPVVHGPPPLYCPAPTVAQCVTPPPKAPALLLAGVKDFSGSLKSKSEWILDWMP